MSWVKTSVYEQWYVSGTHSLRDRFSELLWQGYVTTREKRRTDLDSDAGHANLVQRIRAWHRKRNKRNI